MPRDGSGAYSYPAGGDATSGEVISSTKYNTRMSDILADLNLDRPVAAGGTGASSAPDARTNLGAQAQDDLLDAIAALTTAADRLIYATGVDTVAVTALTAFARTLLAGADAAAMRTILGAGDLISTNNLSDVDNATTARGNIGAYGSGDSPTFGSLTFDRGLFASSGRNFYIDGGASDYGVLGARISGDTADAEVVIWKASGEVGIGTDNPDGTLHVQTSDASVGTPDASGADVVVERNANAGISILTPNTSKGAVIFGDPEDTSRGWVQYDHAADEMLIGVSNGTRVTIDGSGKLVADAVQARIYVNGVSTGPLTAANTNAQRLLTGGITVPNGVFTAGDIVGPLLAGAAPRTITRGTGVSMYVNGVNVASATLAARGVCSIIWQSSSFCYVTGDVS